MFARLGNVLFSLVLLCNCSSVGPGFAHHPIDCAIGFAWADCLEGTPGYNNGGGQQTRAAAAAADQATVNAQSVAARAQCESDTQTSALDPIRGKVELWRTSPEAPPPFEIASNDTFPIEPERPVIAQWAKIREECISRLGATPLPATADPLQATVIQQDRAFGTEVSGRVSALIVALYQGKLTYGEFAQKRYEISRDGTIAERQFRAASMIADRERQLQARQIAQQQFQSNLLAWSTYMQTVNARQPQTVHLDGTVRLRTNCTSQQLGSFSNTNCN
jgi:hypothetical protein